MTDSPPSPGRRRGGPDTRGALLTAARAEIEAHGLDALSLRSTAKRAGLNPAMVGYHFGGKEGLFQALLDDGFSTLLDTLPSPATFAETVPHLLRHLRADPSLARIMVACVYDDGPLRRHFETAHAPRLAALYRHMLQSGQADGSVRQDLTAQSAIRALISLIVFPSIAGPNLTRNLGAPPTPEAEAATILTLFSPTGGPR